MTKENFILIIVVNYNNEIETDSFIRNLISNQKNVNLQFLIANNSSKNISILEKCELEYDQVTLVNCPSNLGYFGGAYFAQQNFLKNNTLPLFTILSNTDMEIKQNNYFEQLQLLHNNSDTDVICTDIVVPASNTHQNPYYKNRISKKHIALLYYSSKVYWIYQLYTLLHYLKRKCSKQLSELQASGYIYAPHGSHIIFKKSFFEKGATLLYPSFLYVEEIFIAEQCLKLNLKVYFEAALQLFHHEHATTGFFKSKKQIQLFNQSQSYIYHTFFK